KRFKIILIAWEKILPHGHHYRNGKWQRGAKIHERIRIYPLLFFNNRLPDNNQRYLCVIYTYAFNKNPKKIKFVDNKFSPFSSLSIDLFQ
ncbi:MAG: hypothetical protein KBA28_13850, partial [Syntrophaceae bacterium]|nr:hypothetical protein [Syntrophaceae bacterium]